MSKEDIFVAVAWIYELYREEKLTPEAFARRFDKRLQDLGMAQAGNAALALNLYGLNAPEALFTDHRADLAQLASERIWRLAKSGTGTLAGRFFHPQISRLIYDALVPREELVRRAEDIARGFDAMLEGGEAADAFLAWLGSRKIGKSARGALMLDEPMRIEILKALWPYFRRRGAVHDVTPRLLRWHQATLGAGIELGASGIKARIQSWWHESDEDEPRWSLLFQMVWDAADEPERLTLMARGRAWLETHIDAGSWAWIYQRFLKFSDADGDLRALGLRWLDCNPADPYWPSVWGSLFATLDSSDQAQKEREELLRLAPKAIPVQPECEADLPVWERTAKLDPLIVDFFAAVMRKLATVRSPYKVEKGVDLLLRFAAPGELVIRLSTALQETMAGRAWPDIWTTFLIKRPGEQGLLALGRDWLTDRENQPEWSACLSGNASRSLRRPPLMANSQTLARLT